MALERGVCLEAARALGFSEAFLKAHTRFAPGDPHVQAGCKAGRRLFDKAVATSYVAIARQRRA